MDVLALSLLLLAACASSLGSYHDSDGHCGCCWPIPEKCCKKPPPPTTTLPPVTPTPPPVTETPPPITNATTTTDPCPCKGDVAILIDRTGSVEPHELDYVKLWLEDVLEVAEPCFRTAMIAFWEPAQIVYDFGSAESTDADLAITAMNTNISAPSGDTNAGRGLAITRGRLASDLNPTLDGCRSVLMLHDGGSDDKNNTYEKAALLAEKLPDVIICMVAMEDPLANPTQNANRIEELETIIQRSNPGSMIVDHVDFVTPIIPPGLLDEAFRCLCKCQNP